MSIIKIRLFVGFCVAVLPSISMAITFIDIWEYRVDGVESIDKSAVQKAITPFLGAARTIDDVDKAAQAIQKLYQQAGMPTTAISVPEQDIVGGVIRIQVDESKVRRVRIIGSRYFSLQTIREQFPSLASGNSLNFKALQADVKKSNQLNKDLKVVPALKAGPVPGTVDVDLNVADELPMHGGFEITNYHTSSTTPTRIAADFRYGNLWQRHHEASLQMQLTPEDTEEVKVLAGSYLFPVRDNSAKVALYTVLSDSELATVNDINVIGEGAIFGARWVQPLSQSKESVHSVSIGFDYKDFKEDLIFLGGEVRKTPISYTTFSSQYNLYARGKNITDSLSVGVTFGSRILNDADELNEKRFQADSSFALWKFDWRRNYALSERWDLSHRLRGQITESPLVSNEQISAGGITSVRGYFESQIQGDSGLIASVELSRPLLKDKWSWLDSLSGHVFYDAARVFLKEALADQDNDISIQSIGVGVKGTVFENWQLKLDGGLPLEDQGAVKENNFRARASARYEF